MSVPRRGPTRLGVRVLPAQPPGVLHDRDLFGETACALEARARLAGRIWVADSRQEVRVLFDEPRLTERDRRALQAAAGGASLVPGTAGSLALLETKREILVALAADRPAFRALLAAHDAAHRPRGRPRIMGILNVTPDSFSDGGRHATPEAAVEHGLKLLSQGAEILDVGGESTRPGSLPVSAEEELDRVLPVVEGLARETDAPISIDTTKAVVAARATEAGATIVNDVSAGRMDPELLGVVADQGADVILMHMRGTPRDMQVAPGYTDVVREVCAQLRERVSAAIAAGIPCSRIIVDPGIGFGKRTSDNVALIEGLPELRSLGLPIALGVSRKSFLGRLSGEERPSERRSETVAALALGCALGAELHRVHDVPGARAALAVAQALVERE